ncbi:MAG: T9SS type A sorting domain-containing protein [Bacteroidales bacterium]|nr:T9SS type A sorting domain-containing protein [Bacteroidales bacterium]
MIKKFLKVFTIIGVALILVSWGGTGHRKISYNVSLSFNSEMSIFNSWASYLRDHASDADSRKQSDPTEAPKHYIDIENFSGFTTTGKINQTSYYSTDEGILPWATIATFDSLRNCLIRHDIDKAKQFAADLGHYVGDGHMPLHITKNFDGQLTGNNGIHSRYETTMIDTYSSQISYTGSSISVITNVNQYVFDYIYANYKYKDSVLIADNYAKTQSNYTLALWNKTGGFTTKLFKNASHALAELIYTAWVQAGKPSLTATSDEQNPNIQFTEALEQNSPNPFTSYTSIKYNLNENADVILQVKDVLGNNVATLFKGFKPAGSYTLDWIPQNQHEGIYFIVLDTRKIHQVKKMILVR